MSKVVVSQFTSIDGVYEDPGGGDGTGLGAWTFEFDRGDEGNKFKLDEVMEAEALLLGRGTYEGFAQAWPSRDGDFADKFNGMRKYVVTSTLKDPDWNNTVVIDPTGDGAIADAVRKAKDEHEGTILVNGSGPLVKTLLEEGLVDELVLMVHPVVLGRGKRLLEDGFPQATMKLKKSLPVGPDGVIVLVYEPAS